MVDSEWATISLHLHHIKMKSLCMHECKLVDDGGVMIWIQDLREKIKRNNVVNIFLIVWDLGWIMFFSLSRGQGLRQDNLNGKRMEIILFVIIAYKYNVYMVGRLKVCCNFRLVGWCWLKVWVWLGFQMDTLKWNELWRVLSICVSKQANKMDWSGTLR